MRISGSPVLSGIARFYVSVIRGTPLLVQLFVIFYGLPSLGIVLDPWPCAIIAFSLNVGGYAAEIIRAAVLSVPKGQWEAAYTIGMPRRDGSRAHHPAAGRPRVGAAAVEHVHLAGQGHLAGFADPRDASCSASAQEIAAFSLGVHDHLHRGRRSSTGCSASCSRRGRAAIEKRLDRYVAR